MRTLFWKVPASGAGLSIEEFLREKGCSHHVLRLLKHTENGILLNEEPAFSNVRLQEGDKVTIHLEEPGGSDQISSVPLALNIIFEDEDILIVDKPAGMPVHPSVNNHENTLANAVRYHYASNGESHVFHCINRLDRDTSGLLVVAKNALSSAVLSDPSSKKDLRREYFAIVEGRLPIQGTIDRPIGRQEGSALARCIDPVHGDPAITHYRRIAYFKKRSAPEITDTADLPRGVSVASVTLDTGRTHQIRVHMASIGHPLPGDFLYNPESVCELAPRQMLHARRLTLRHPVTQKLLTFECELPPEMTRFLDCYDRIE